MTKKHLKIKQGDTVRIIAGKDKGKEGKVIQVFPAMEKLVVEKANMMKKHLKPQKQGEQGQVVEFAAPVHISNVMILDPDTNKPSRIGYKKAEDGTKIRISKKSGSSI